MEQERLQVLSPDAPQHVLAGRLRELAKRFVQLPQSLDPDCLIGHSDLPRCPNFEEAQRVASLLAHCLDVPACPVMGKTISGADSFRYAVPPDRKSCPRDAPRAPAAINSESETSSLAAGTLQASRTHVFMGS